MKTITVFGGGIAVLTAVHELSAFESGKIAAMQVCKNK